MRSFSQREWALINKFRTINLEPTAFEETIQRFSSKLLAEWGVEVNEEDVIVYDHLGSITSYIEGSIADGEKFLTRAKAELLVPTHLELVKHTYNFGQLRVLFERPMLRSDGTFRHYPHSMRGRLIGGYPMFHHAFNYYNSDPTDVRWRVIEKLNSRLTGESQKFHNIVKQKFSHFNATLDNLLRKDLEHWTHPEQVWSTIQSLQLDKEEPEDLRAWQQERRYEQLKKLKRSA